MLKIENVSVKNGEKVILENFTLEIKPGEIHALMGQNGAGKSTIAKVLLRDAHYDVSGSISFHDKNLLLMNTTEVAREGIFLVMQNPIEIAGVTNAEVLRTALNDRGMTTGNILEFNRELTEHCKRLELPTSFIHRDINYNMSGGEKKKNALLHLWMLKPNFLILDEIDSGLDVDSLKKVSHSLLEYYETYHPSILVITHQKTLLDILKPPFVHILQDKHIAKSGDFSLAEQIFQDGFGASTMRGGERNE